MASEGSASPSIAIQRRRAFIEFDALERVVRREYPESLEGWVATAAAVQQLEEGVEPEF